MVNEILDGARVILSLTILTYASWSDWKNREVSNRVWIVFAPAAFALTAVQYVVFEQHLLFYFVLSFTITSVIATALFYAGAFGGADAKALMCLALALPNPIYLLPSVAFFSPILPLTVFSNAVLLAVFTVVYALFRNALWKIRKDARLFEGFENESAWRKILALATGYKVQLATLEKKNAHVYPLEDYTIKETGGDERRLLLFPKDETQETIVARLLSAGREGKIQDGVWVTPGLPLLIFITAGLVIALLFGDIIWLILRYILVPI